MRLKAFLQNDLKAMMEAEVRATVKSMHRGLGQATDGLKKDLRGQVQRAGLGQKLAHTWRGKVYENQGHNPAGLVYSRAPQVIAAHDKGMVIRAGNKKWLAIPTENTPKSIGRRRATPENLLKNGGYKFRFVRIDSQTALLVMDQARRVFHRKSGEYLGARQASARALRKGEAESLVMFVLKRQVKSSKRLDVAFLGALWAAQLPHLIERAYKEGT